MLSVGLTVVQWVVLKMLPFDNKSEFQVVVEMPAGTPLEGTASALHEMGVFLSQQAEVRDLQGYAGTASPIKAGRVPGGADGLGRGVDLRLAADLLATAQSMSGLIVPGPLRG